MADLFPILDDNQIALEQNATKTFSAAVEDFNRGKLVGATTAATSTVATTTQTSLRQPGTYYSSSYAAALAGGTSYRPKLKFLFKVEFIFTPEAVQQFPTIFGGSTAQDFTFMVKSVDRPKIDFEYDDVNMYNFKTKVLKNIRHRELTITFMDDVGNRVLNFFRALMMIHSPITRRQLVREQAASEDARLAAPDANSISAANGMAFTDAPTIDLNDNAIRGTVNSSIGNVIQTIRVKQMYVDSGAALGDASKEVIFDFINGRLVSFDLDDLSHEASDPNIMTMQFDYDWMEIVHSGSLTKTDTPIYNVTVPGVNGAPSDTSPSGRQGSGQGGTGVQTLATNAYGITAGSSNLNVATSAGGGTYTTMPAGIVGAAQQSLATKLSTPVVNQAGATYSDANIIGPPAKPVGGSVSVFDSAEGGPSPIEGFYSTVPGATLT